MNDDTDRGSLAHRVQTKGHGPDRFISITRARLIARYRMHTNGAKPEELETNALVETDPGVRVKRVVSIGFAGGEMRIRKHGGPGNRNWADTRDFQPRDGWLSEVYAYLDDFLGFTPATERKEPPHTPLGPGHPDWVDGKAPRNAPRVP